MRAVVVLSFFHHYFICNPFMDWRKSVRQFSFLHWEHCVLLTSSESLLISDISAFHVPSLRVIHLALFSMIWSHSLVCFQTCVSKKKKNTYLLIRVIKVFLLLEDVDWISANNLSRAYIFRIIFSIQRKYEMNLNKEKTIVVANSTSWLIGK